MGERWESNHPKLMNVHEEIYYFLYQLKNKGKSKYIKNSIISCNTNEMHVNLMRAC